MMKRNNTTIRTSVLATMVAAAMASPVVMAAGAEVLETRPPATPAAVADHGARLIIRYRDGQAARATKLKTVNNAARRSHAARMVGTAAQARQPAPTAHYMRKLAVGADLVRLSHKVDKAELNALVRELSADPAVKLVEIDRMMHPVDGGKRVASRVLVQPQLVVDDQY